MIILGTGHGGGGGWSWGWGEKIWGKKISFSYFGLKHPENKFQGDLSTLTSGDWGGGGAKKF